MQTQTGNMALVTPTRKRQLSGGGAGHGKKSQAPTTELLCEMSRSLTPSTCLSFSLHAESQPCLPALRDAAKMHRDGSPLSTQRLQGLQLHSRAVRGSDAALLEKWSKASP